MAKKKDAQTKKVNKCKGLDKNGNFSYEGHVTLNLTPACIVTGDVLVSVTKKYTRITDDPSKDKPIIIDAWTEEEIHNVDIYNLEEKCNDKYIENSQFVYSEDYSSVSIHGNQHTLTKLQSEVIKILHNAKSEAPYLRQTYILEQINTEANNLEKIFQNNKEAYKCLIIADGKRGQVRLNIDSRKN